MKPIHFFYIKIHFITKNKLLIANVTFFKLKLFIIEIFKIESYKIVTYKYLYILGRN